MIIPKIAIIGGGNMASSLVTGLCHAGCNPKNIGASDPNRYKLTRLHRKFGIHTSLDNMTVTKESQIIVFAVKPQHLREAAKSIAVFIKKQLPLILSIVAGVRTQTIQKVLGLKTGAIVRSMPNTPALIGQGMTALYATRAVSVQQKRLAEAIMQSVGCTAWIKDEALLDVVTAISGSGPAYFLGLMEALEAVAIELGLHSPMAHTLVVQTALGSATLALKTKKKLSHLRAQVTSKGGTTEAAFKVLNAARTKEIIQKAVRAAFLRSKQLGLVEE
ncbi:MAG: pyrroline-5-carboxylate reductase [Gammaproteobacteria bacterium]|nr:pyrroline-5-carboxylate reductase [Gammaproteobacteria bacterium]